MLTLGHAHRDQYGGCDRRFLICVCHEGFIALGNKASVCSLMSFITRYLTFSVVIREYNDCHSALLAQCKPNLWLVYNASHLIVVDVYFNLQSNCEIKPTVYKTGHVTASMLILFFLNQLAQAHL